MCGIAGFWVHDNDFEFRLAAVTAMTESLWHRGPDEGASHVDGEIGLGVRRLRVIDPQGGHQPMSNEDGSVTVVYNGEIYNHEVLRAELIARGHRFLTRSDTEVIVHAFEEWGEACVQHFNGMFAFAAWDSRAKRLLLARDRLGIKPLYLYEAPGVLVFGSELKAVLTAPWVPLQWDLEAIDEFLTWEYVPGARTVVAGVRKLPPATTMLFSADGPPRSRRYWRLEARPQFEREADAIEELRARLGESVSRRLLADVPVGAFLSGGVDSSVIVSLAAQQVSAPLATFTLGFEDGSYDERAPARRLAEHLGTRHHEALVDPHVVERAEELAGFLDEPFGDVSTFPTYLVSAQARSSVTVALSGDGGDELFGGYDQHRAHRWAARLRWLAGRWPASAVDRLLERVPPRPSKKGVVNFTKRFVEGLRHPEDLEHARWWVFLGERDRDAVYTPDLRARLAGFDPLAHYRGKLAEASDAGYSGLQRQLYADISGYLPDDILTKVDRMSMAVSLEARVPFLDHEVVECAMRIPERWKIRRGEGKWILREAFRGALPAGTLDRPKQGFSIPMKNWLRGPLRGLLHEATSLPRLRDLGWFDPSELNRRVAEHESGAANHAHLLWCLISLDLSMRHLNRVVAERPRRVRQVVA
jgi:asparagine synthase (glutamine-hydrolysing)